MKKIKISVPSSSGNIGVGFDVLGLALNLFNHFTFEKKEDFKVFSPYPEFNNKNHLANLAFEETLESLNCKIPKIHLTFEGDIPPARGLASSGTCIIAGVIAGLYFADKELNNYEIIKRASDIEGHPDNIVSQVLGGITASIYEDELYYSKNSIIGDINALVVVPNYNLETKISRMLIPKAIPLTDAISNMAQSILLMETFRHQKYDNLQSFLQDHIHQEVRSIQVDYFDEICNEALNNDAYGAYLSGAGPSILIFKSKDNKQIEKSLEKLLKDKDLGFGFLELEFNNQGVYINDKPLNPEETISLL